MLPRRKVAETRSKYLQYSLLLIIINLLKNLITFQDVEDSSFLLIWLMFIKIASTNTEVISHTKSHQTQRDNHFV